MIQRVDLPLRFLTSVNDNNWSRSVCRLEHMSQNRNNHIPQFESNNPWYKEMMSDSVEQCGTEVCFLHIQLIGTNVLLPKTHNVPPEVDLESS